MTSREITDEAIRRRLVRPSGRTPEATRSAQLYLHVLNAAARNAFVASVADELFVAYAEPGGNTEHLCRDALAAGKAVLTFGTAENKNLLSLGARPISEGGDWIIRAGLTIDGRQ